MDASISINGIIHSVKSGKAIGDTIHNLGHSPDTFIFVVNGKPVPMDIKIEEGMKIDAIKVASGG